MGNQGLLLRIDVEKQLKPRVEPAAAIRSFYAYHGYARFIVENKLVCSGDRKAHLGKRTLFFIVEDRLVRGEPIFHDRTPVFPLGTYDFLQEAENGLTEAPKRFSEYSVLSFEKVLAAVDRLTETTGDRE
jgi:hypothetical protein